MPKGIPSKAQYFNCVDCGKRTLRNSNFQSRCGICATQRKREQDKKNKPAPFDRFTGAKDAMRVEAEGTASAIKEILKPMGGGL